jgi:hypothetical protein
MKKLPPLLLGLAIVEAISVVALIASPNDCECDQPRIAPIVADFPQPEERPTAAPVLA